MATVEVAKEQREAADGQKYVKSFIEWCNKTDSEKSPEMLQTWDVKHNHSRMEKLFEETYDLREYALKSLYARYFWNYSRLFVANPKGKTVCMSRFRSTPAGWTDLSCPNEVSDEKWEAITIKLKLIAKSTILRMGILGAPKQQRIEMLLEAEELYGND